MDGGYKPYKKSFAHSYTFGMFPTVELIKNRPDDAHMVLVSSDYRHDDASPDIFEFCRQRHIDVKVNDKQFNRIGAKENCYVIGVFNKYECVLDADKSHVVLVNPSNMGNMGTIIRTLTGFGIENLAVISPGADIFDPKVIRASMGAVFRINFKYYDSFSAYREASGDRDMYAFMLDGEVSLKDMKRNMDRPFSLIFGNEATGLDSSYHDAGISVVIGHTDRIDSLNLTIAAGIALYEFCS